MKTIKKAIFAAIIAAAGIASSASATLIGETVTATGNGLSPTVSTINGEGMEFYGLNNFLNIDFGANTLTITATDGSQWAGWGQYVFAGFAETISGFSLASNNGFSGKIVEDFAFGEHSINLNLDSGAAAFRGAQVVFNVTTGVIADTPAGEVPEPTTVALLGLGLLGVAAARRKQAKGNAA